MWIKRLHYYQILACQLKIKKGANPKSVNALKIAVFTYENDVKKIYDIEKDNNDTYFDVLLELKKYVDNDDMVIEKKIEDAVKRAVGSNNNNNGNFSENDLRMLSGRIEQLYSHIEEINNKLNRSYNELRENINGIMDIHHKFNKHKEYCLNKHMTTEQNNVSTRSQLNDLICNIRNDVDNKVRNIEKIAKENIVYRYI